MLGNIYVMKNVTYDLILDENHLVNDNKCNIVNLQCPNFMTRNDI